MDRDSLQDKRTRPAGRVTTLYDDICWSVIYSREDDAVYISSLDYHAGPLKIDRTMAERFSSVLGIHGEKEHGEVQAKAEERLSPAGPVVRLNQKERCAEIAVAGSIVKLTRKELYRLGKQLGKRAKMRSVR